MGSARKANNHRHTGIVSGALVKVKQRFSGFLMKWDNHNKGRHHIMTLKEKMDLQLQNIENGTVW